MKTHRYQISLKWDDNSGKGTTDYRSYSRDHLISAPGKMHMISGSSDPSFLGDPKKFNPEELLVSSISSCHMLWYLHLCASNGIVVVDYVDNAIGTMEESENGSGRFTKVTLHPEVIVENDSMIEKAISLHEKAHQMCFIANSCNFPIDHAPKVTVKNN